MLIGFAIKKNVYQGSDGVLTDSLSDLQVFDTKQEAIAASANNGGQVINVHRQEPRPRKPSRRNQSWMRQ
jgi:hypothetical protein